MPHKNEFHELCLRFFHHGIHTGLERGWDLMVGKNCPTVVDRSSNRLQYTAEGKQRNGKIRGAACESSPVPCLLQPTKQPNLFGRE